MGSKCHLLTSRRLLFDGKKAFLPLQKFYKLILESFNKRNLNMPSTLRISCLQRALPKVQLFPWTGLSGNYACNACLLLEESKNVFYKKILSPKFTVVAKKKRSSQLGKTSFLTESLSGFTFVMLPAIDLAGLPASPRSGQGK